MRGDIVPLSYSPDQLTYFPMTVPISSGVGAARFLYRPTGSGGFQVSALRMPVNAGPYSVTQSRGNSAVVRKSFLAQNKLRVVLEKAAAAMVKEIMAGWL
jgi:hypothetical protein